MAVCISAWAHMWLCDYAIVRLGGGLAGGRTIWQTAAMISGSCWSWCPG